MITFLVRRAALAMLLMLACWVPCGPNKGCMGRLNAFAPGLPTCQFLCPTDRPAQTSVTGERLPLPLCHCRWAMEASPAASACSPAARSRRNFSCSWRKQDVDATRTFPGRVPSGRPIASIFASWVSLDYKKGRMGRLYASAPGLSTRQLLCPTAIPAQTPVTGARLPLPLCQSLWALGAGPAASAWLPAAKSWRNFFCRCKHNVDVTRISPGRAPSGRPIESTVPYLLIYSRPGPKSGVGCRLTTLLILLHCQVSHGVRVPALSVGAGEGNLFAYPRRLQVPKLNGVQVIDGKQEPTHQWNRCVKRSFVRGCNRAIRHGQEQPSYLCTSRFIEVPEECVAADHRCLVLNADRKPAAATRPHPWMEWTALRPGPTYASGCGLDSDATSLQVTVSKCEKAVFWRCSTARPPWILN